MKKEILLEPKYQVRPDEPVRTGIETPARLNAVRTGIARPGAQKNEFAKYSIVIVRICMGNKI